VANAGLSSIRRGTALLAIVIFALGVGLRVIELGREGFWVDEIFSVSFASLPALGTLVAVLLLDVHPPLYYLQLNAWGLLGHGDVWMLLNSVCWSAATLLAIFFGTTRRFGATSGLLALALCAVLGSEIFFADELRMYAMCSCLCALSWIAADRLRADYRFRTALPLIILLALLGATHSASVIPASAALLYALPPADRAQLRRLLPTWVAMAAVVACTYLPWVINASMRHVAHAAAPSIQAASHTVGGWIIGYGNAPAPLWAGPVAAIVLTLGLLAAWATVPQLSRIIGWFIAWPLLFGAVLSVTIQPIWLDRTFAFCAPFVAIAFGAATARLLGAYQQARERAALSFIIGLIAVILIGCGALAYRQATTPYKPDRYRELARYLTQHVQSGEIIYAPDRPTFWGLARYLVGPDWGSILKFQDAADLSSLKKWQRLSALVGPAALGRFALLPQTRRLDAFRVPVFTGFSALPEMQNAKVVWLVVFDEVPLDSLQLCTDRYPEPLAFGGLRAYRLECEGAT
jgi:uncharacterized membrane protein